MEDVYFKTIEALLKRDGELNTNDMIERFGFSRPYVSKLFTKYREANPGAMTYIPAGGGSKHQKAKGFKAKFLKGDPDEYLTCLAIVLGK